MYVPNNHCSVQYYAVKIIRVVGKSRVGAQHSNFISDTLKKEEPSTNGGSILHMLMAKIDVKTAVYCGELPCKDLKFAWKWWSERFQPVSFLR